MLQSTDISKCFTVEQACKVSNTDYEVSKSPLVLTNGVKTGLEGTFAEDKFFGVVSSKYSVIQNKDVFKFADDLKEQNSDLTFADGGRLENGVRSFISLQYPNRRILDDDYGSKLFIVNSFDGNSGIKICFLPERLFCSNKINMAFAHAKERWSVYHSPLTEIRMNEAVASLKKADEYWDMLSKTLTGMSTKKIDFDKFIKQLFPKVTKAPANKWAQTSSEKVLDSIYDIWNNKQDLQNYNGTAFKAFQTIADYVSNADPLRKTSKSEEKRFSSFLSGNNLMLKAQKLLNVA